MLQIFNITLNQTLTLLIFISFGFWLKKTNKVTKEFSKGLSVTLVNIFTPLLSLRTFANNFTRDFLSEKSIILVAGFAALLICLSVSFVLSHIFARTKGVLDKNRFDVFLYSLSISNFGYFGYPLVEALFGEEMLFNFMIFCIPFTIFIYTFGIYLLNPDKVLSFKKLLNVPMLGMIIGMFIGLLQINLPAAFKNVLSIGGDCMAPVAMVLTGIVFASNNLKNMLNNLKVYITFFIKLLIVPVIFIYTMSFLQIRTDVAVCIITILSLPAGLNSIVFPEAFGGDSKTGAQLCFVSTVMAVLSLPIVFSLFNLILK